MAHLSDSRVQRDLELPALLAACSRLELDPQYLEQGRRLDVGGGASVVLDGWLAAPGRRPAAFEVYVSLGPPKGGQTHKLKADVLKLLLVRRVRVEARVRAVVVVTSAGAAEWMSKGWVARTLELFEVEMVFVELSEDQTAALRAAKKRQARGMAPRPTE